MAKLEEFYDPKKDILSNPVDFFNQYGKIEDVLNGFGVDIKEDAIYSGPVKVAILEDMYITFVENYTFQKGKTIKHTFAQGQKITKFQLYTKIKHNGNYIAATSDVDYKELGSEIGYIRIGVNYFKKTIFPDLYGFKKRTLLAWSKDEIKTDYGQEIFKRIPKFDGSIMRPNNKNYSQVVDGYYNWYSPFEHKAVDVEVTEDMIPNSIYVMRHVFKEQFEQGLKYMKILYNHPNLKTYVLCLVSEQRNTGKTTFLNWLNMIFLDNFVTTDIITLEGPFNMGYVTKNIIAIDEAVSGDKSQLVEKVKNLVSAKKVPVNEKYIRGSMMDFFAKIIFCSNKNLDFIRIDKEEDRFWIRKLTPIPQDEVNLNIEDDLKNEIPLFLKFIDNLPELDIKYRFVMRPEEVLTESLVELKKESMPQLYKDLYLYFQNYFSENEFVENFYASAVDIKEEFFKYDSKNSSSYIAKVLKLHYKLTPTDKVTRYTPFNKINDGRQISKTGLPFLFKREMFFDNKDLEEIIDEITEELPF
jgi:hypothetical protein